MERERKKQLTRQRISDVATALFLKRGFETVTFDDIAAKAKVSRMTVFNYFPRKEDLILDRTDELRLEHFRVALRGPKPLAALRTLVAAHPASFDRHTAAWWEFVNASPALVARLRELDDEAIDGLAKELVGPFARLAAAMIVATVRTAREEGMRARSQAKFLEIFDRGLSAVSALGWQ